MNEARGLWRSCRSPWAFLALGTLLYWTAANVLRPFLSLHLASLGASDGQIGLVFAAYPFMSLFLALPAGLLVDRVGSRKVAILAALGMVSCGIAYTVVATPLGIVAVLALSGIAELGVWLGLQALATQSGSGFFLTRQLALFSVAWGLGIVLGPFIGGVSYEWWGFTALAWLYLTMAALLTVSTVVTPRRSRMRGTEPDAGPQSTAGGTGGSLGSRVRRIYAQPLMKVVLVATFVGMFVQAARISFYPLFLEEQGISVSAVGMLLGVMGIASLIIRLLVPALTARWSNAVLLRASMWFALGGMAITPLLSTVWALLLGALVIGVGIGLSPPLTVEAIGRATQANQRGLAMGMRISVNRAAQLSQPLLFGGLAALSGLALAFPISGVLLAGLVVFSLRKRPTPD